MAHGFLTPQPVTGEGSIKVPFKKLYDGLKKLFQRDLRVVNANVKEVRDLLPGGQKLPQLPPSGQKMLGGSNTPKLLSGSISGAIVPRKAGIVNTQAKSDIVGRNATNIDRKEQRYLGTTDPDVAGGPQTRKGGGFTDFGSTPQAKPLSDSNFFSKAVNEGIDASTGEYLSKSARIAAFQKGRVARNPDQGPNISPDSGADIVAAINRNTEAIVALSSLTKDQTSKQVSMHNATEARAERRENRELARREERQLERGGDYSGNLTPTSFKGRRLLPGAGGTGGGRGRRDGGDFFKTLGRRAISGSTKAGSQAILKGTRAGALKLAEMGAKQPLSAYETAAKMTPKASQNIAKLLFGTAKAAPIVKTMATGAKAGQKAVVSAVSAVAPSAKALQAGSASAMGVKANKIVKKRSPFSQADELDGIRTITNIGEAGDDAVNAAKMAKSLAEEGVPKPQIAKTIADTFPNVTKSLKTGVSNSSTAKLAGKVLGSAAGKSVLKKIPVIAGLAGIGFGIQRALEGDYLGAVLEVSSGIMGATGVGAGASLGIDAFLLARDMGVTPFAKGGIITQPTAGLVGEAGPEGVFPLSGAEGKKTFDAFGNAFVDAQIKRKKEVAQVQAEGLELFSKKREYMKVFDFFFGGFGGGDDDDTGNGGTRSTSPMVGPPPPVSGGRKGGTPLNSTGAKGVLDVIASVESNGNYDVFNTARGGTPGKATEKTIGWLAKNAQGAIGRYQHMPEFILERAARFGYDANTLFTPVVQDDITIKMMQEQHGLDDFLSANMSAAKFAAKLAPTWRGLPQGQKAANRLGGTADSTYMDQYSSGNKAHMSWADSVSNFERIQAGAGQIPEYDPKAKYKTGDLVNMNGKVRQFDGFGWASPSGMSSQSFEPQASNANTGTPIMATSAQVASGSSTAAPTVINNYYTGGGGQQASVNPNGVGAGISMQDAGLGAFTDLKIRTS